MDQKNNRCRVAVMLLTASLIPIGTASLGPAAPAEATVEPDSLVLDGHGYGHGVGLSQYGALGYALNFGWSAGQILDHFYGGTVAATAPNTDITVRLNAHDGAIQTAVVHDKGAVVVDGLAGGPWRSLAAREMSAGHYAVWARSDGNVCPASTTDLDDPSNGWTKVVADAPLVTFRTQADVAASPDVADLIGLCEPTTGRVRHYRGSIRAVNSSSGANRTVSQLPVEQYVRSVVAGEMSAGWAAMGGGKGAQALQAQAVAARSYALVESREPYAKTCDSNCQTYRGAAYRAGVAGAIVAQ
ncbi:MAG: SpoIID/LytB domain-containing protein, partial [Ilumatobacteraceae bacterium]